MFIHRFGVSHVTVQLFWLFVGQAEHATGNHLGWKRHLRSTSPEQGHILQKAHSLCHTSMSWTSRQCVLQLPLTAFCSAASLDQMVKSLETGEGWQRGNLWDSKEGICGFWQGLCRHGDPQGERFLGLCHGQSLPLAGENRDTSHSVPHSTPAFLLPKTPFSLHFEFIG